MDGGGTRLSGVTVKNSTNSERFGLLVVLCLLLSAPGGAVPGYRTATHISSREDIGVIVFGNSLDTEVYPGSAWSITDRIFDWVVPAIMEAREGKERQGIQPGWGALVGTYRMIWGDAHILFLEGKMCMVNPNSPDPKRSVTTLEPIAGSKFRIHRKPGTMGYDPVGERVSFEFGPDRKVKRVKIAANYCHPVEL